MGEPEVVAFLTHLAVDRRVAEPVGVDRSKRARNNRSCSSVIVRGR